MSTQKNSFVTIAEQISLLNQNNIEVLSALNDIVTSQDSSVNVTITDDNGNQNVYALPSVGNIQNEITVINSNIQRLSGLNNNTVHIINGNSTKIVYTADLNVEPNRIDALSAVTQFNSNNNFFFDEFLNPLLTVKFDLTNIIGDDVDGVIARRYFVQFETDPTGALTSDGIIAQNDFMNLYVGKTNINISDFLNWLQNPSMVGIVDNTTPLYTDHEFQFDYQQVNAHGVFSVISQELDTVNNKLWFHIYPYTYTTLDGIVHQLQVNDELILNKQDSVTRWNILETSFASSEFRIRVERVEGYDPIPTGTNILKYYSDVTVEKIVEVNVGFNEYLVVFMIPTNSKNNLKNGVWSTGTGLYTNNLLLDTNSNITLAQYYLNNVSDYGNAIKDLVATTLPVSAAITPNAPVLVSTNFKVVQTNQHLTDTSDTSNLLNLQSQKTQLKNKLDQINTAITQKNQAISTTKYSSVAQQQQDQNELAALQAQQTTYSANLYSITQQMVSNTTLANTPDPTYSARGFWLIPDPVQQTGYRPQEVIQFETQFRKYNINGTQNQTQGYNIVSGDTTVTGYFSNWTSVLSGVRQRVFDSTNNKWVWKTEDITDADTPNINQLDIPILPNEQIDIRVRSISEVGYPTTLTESNWSNILTIPFPSNLSTISSQNSTILQDAQSDNANLAFQQTLTSQGITQHVSNSFNNGNQYVAHLDSNIQTVFKDTQGNSFTLQDYLKYLTDQINSLNTAINSLKGALNVFVYNGTNEVQVSNNSSTIINVNVINYGSTTDNINYTNNTYIITDFYIRLSNSSSGDLNFLISEFYQSGSTVRTGNSNLPCLVDVNNNLLLQQANQFLYFCDTANGKSIYNGNTFDDITQYSSNPSYTYLSANLNSTTQICGLSGNFVDPVSPTNPVYSALGVINNPSGLNDWDIPGGFCTLICPKVNSINDLIVSDVDFYTIGSNNDLTIPINIYWKFKGTTDATIQITGTQTPITHTKTLRMRFRPLSLNVYFDFNVVFTLNSVVV